MKINIGCDLVCLSRFKKTLENKRVVNRIFHQNEKDYCDSKKNRLASYAARFGAKEAFAKALGTGLFAKGIAPIDIWVENDSNGKPQIVVSEKLKKILKKQKISGWDISLSHHGDYAMANVILYSK